MLHDLHELNKKKIYKEARHDHTRVKVALLTKRMEFSQEVYLFGCTISLSQEGVVCLVQLIFPSPVQKFPAFYGTRSFRSSPLVRIMSQMNPVRNIALFFFKTHFNIILSFMAAVFQAALSCPSGLHIGALSISLLPHARHISCPSHHP